MYSKLAATVKKYTAENAWMDRPMRITVFINKSIDWCYDDDHVC